MTSFVLKAILLLVSSAVFVSAGDTAFLKPNEIASSSIFGVSRGGGLFGGKSKDQDTAVA